MIELEDGMWLHEALVARMHTGRTTQVVFLRLRHMSIQQLSSELESGPCVLVNRLAVVEKDEKWDSLHVLAWCSGLVSVLTFAIVMSLSSAMECKTGEIILHGPGAKSLPVPF